MPIKVEVVYACDACGAAVYDADEMLCPKCKYPKLAGLVDRVFELLGNPRNLLLLAVLDKQKANLDQLTDLQLFVLARTGADFALLDEYVDAILETPAVIVTATDGFDLRVLSKIIKRIRAKAQS